MADIGIESALKALQQPTHLTVHTLSEPILSTTPSNKKDTRTSDFSDTSPIYSPAALSADLSHYKDLFRKLRFSYTEQVTKERFLKSLVSDNPSDFLSSTTAAGTTALEAQLVQDKAALKQKKQDVSTLLAEIETLAREVAQRDQSIQTQIAEVSSLPATITALQERRDDLRARQPVSSENEELNLGLEATTQLLETREQEFEDLELRVSELKEAVPERKRQVDEMRREMGGLERRKREAIDGAVEAKRRRKGGDGGGGDELERRGRWLKANESVLRSLLEV